MISDAFDVALMEVAITIVFLLIGYVIVRATQKMTSARFSYRNSGWRGLAKASDNAASSSTSSEASTVSEPVNSEPVNSMRGIAIAILMASPNFKDHSDSQLENVIDLWEMYTMGRK